MNFKLGPKTFSMPSAGLPQIALPYLKLLTAVRIPIPKAFRFGGGRAALMSILVVAGGFGAAFALVIHGTSDVPTWPEAGAVYALPNISGQRLAPDESDSHRCDRHLHPPRRGVAAAMKHLRFRVLAPTRHTGDEKRIRTVPAKSRG